MSASSQEIPGQGSGELRDVLGMEITALNLAEKFVLVQFERNLNSKTSPAMAVSTEKPQQHSQPSRKRKRDWRKNIDVSEIEAGLESARDQVIKGSVL